MFGFHLIASIKPSLQAATPKSTIAMRIYRFAMLEKQ
jgi:hypothetical protein